MQREEFRIFITVCGKNAYCPSVLPPATSSSHTIEARGLKIGMHIPHMDGSKVTHQIFDVLPRS